tara:strand:+ start:154 stop:1068 length:915 start_codon:yes stop_codon:yes gene_type:complete
MAEIIGPSLDQLDTWGTLDSLDAYGTLEYLDNINLFEVAAAESIAVTGTGSANFTAAVSATALITINAATTVVYDVTVASGTNSYGTGNKYYIAGISGPGPALQLVVGSTYRFDQSDSSNSGHPLRFSTTANGSHGGGSEYTTGVTTTGTPGTANAYTEITVSASTPSTLHYYCTNHSGMGGEATISSFDFGLIKSFAASATISITGTAVATERIIETSATTNIAITATGNFLGTFAVAASDTIAISGSTTTGVNYRAVFAASINMTIEGVAIAEEMGEAWTDIVPATSVFNTRTAGTDRWLNQ